MGNSSTKDTRNLNLKSNEKPIVNKEFVDDKYHRMDFDIMNEMTPSAPPIEDSDTNDIYIDGYKDKIIEDFASVFQLDTLPNMNRCKEDKSVYIFSNDRSKYNTYRDDFSIYKTKIHNRDLGDMTKLMYFETKIRNINSLDNNLLLFNVLCELIHPRTTINMYDFYNSHHPMIILKNIEYFMELLKYNCDKVLLKDFVCFLTFLDNVSFESHLTLEQYKDRYSRYYIDYYRLIAVDNLIALLTISIKNYEIITGNKEKYKIYIDELDKYSKKLILYIRRSNNSNLLKKYTNIDYYDEYLVGLYFVNLSKFTGEISYRMERRRHIDIDRIMHDKTMTDSYTEVYDFNKLLEELKSFSMMVKEAFDTEPTKENKDFIVYYLYMRSEDYEGLVKYMCEYYIKIKDYYRFSLLYHIFYTTDIKEGDICDYFYDYAGKEILYYMFHEIEIEDECEWFIKDLNDNVNREFNVENDLEMVKEPVLDFNIFDKLLEHEYLLENKLENVNEIVVGENVNEIVVEENVNEVVVEENVNEVVVEENVNEVVVVEEESDEDEEEERFIVKKQLMRKLVMV